MKILIVEDEAHLADGLRFNLEADGYEAEIAADGDAALEKLRSTDFDAVVLDVMLPTVNGFEVAKQMRATALRQVLTIILQNRSISRSFSRGSMDYCAGGSGSVMNQKPRTLRPVLR